MHNEEALVKVAAGSRPPTVAGAIAGLIREGKKPVLRAIGAGTVNQAVKAVAIARRYLELDEIDIACVPFFIEVETEGQERTAINLQATSSLKIPGQNAWGAVDFLGEWTILTLLHP